MVAFAERFKELRKQKGLTQLELLDLLRRKYGYRLSPASISYYESGRAKPEVERLIGIADFFDVSVDYLLGLSDVKEPLEKEMEDITPIRVTDDMSQFVKLYILGSTVCGTPSEMIEENQLDYHLFPAESGYSTFTHFLLQVKGDSMVPEIPPDSFVVVEKKHDVPNEAIAIVRVGNDEATCKVVVKNEKGIVLVPLNENYDPIEYSMKQCITLPIQILGEVVEVHKKITRPVLPKRVTSCKC